MEEEVIFGLQTLENKLEMLDEKIDRLRLDNIFKKSNVINNKIQNIVSKAQERLNNRKETK